MKLISVADGHQVNIPEPLVYRGLLKKDAWDSLYGFGSLNELGNQENLVTVKSK